MSAPGGQRSRLRRALCAPALHFVAVGAVLTALAPPPRRGAPPPAREPVVITGADVTRLRTAFTRRTGLVPGRADEEALVSAEIDEELLYREALALGLDRGDSSIRYRLVQKMEALAEEPADTATLYRQARALGLDRGDTVVRRMLVNKMRRLAELAADREELDDATLRRQLARRPGRWARPPCVAFEHVFLSAARRGERLAADAARAGAVLAARPTAIAATLADPFPLGHEFPCTAAAGLAQLFGSEFADRVMRLAPGDWSAPIRSAYGLHLVRVTAAQPGGPPPLDAVRTQVAATVRSERRARALKRFLARLRARYQVRIEPEREAS